MEGTLTVALHGSSPFGALQACTPAPLSKPKATAVLPLADNRGNKGIWIRYLLLIKTGNVICRIMCGGDEILRHKTPWETSSPSEFPPRMHLALLPLAAIQGLLVYPSSWFVAALIRDWCHCIYHFLLLVSHQAAVFSVFYQPSPTLYSLAPMSESSKEFQELQSQARLRFHINSRLHCKRGKSLKHQGIYVQNKMWWLPICHGCRNKSEENHFKHLLYTLVHWTEP